MHEPLPNAESWYLPRAQFTQTLGDTCAVLPLVCALPAGHTLHHVVPTSFWYLPVRHNLHTEALFASFWCLPLWHFLHTPLESLYCPLSHAAACASTATKASTASRMTAGRRPSDRELARGGAPVPLAIRRSAGHQVVNAPAVAHLLNQQRAADLTDHS